MPFFVLLLLGTTVAGACAASSEREKRLRMQAEYAARINALASDIAFLESHLATLLSRLSWHHDQVRTLASEIQRLRGELASYRQRAAA